MYSNVTRISGINSGMDTASLVKQLMKAENMKMTKLQQNRQKLEWKQEGYRTVISALESFQSAFLDLTKADSLKRTDAYNHYTVSATYSGSETSAIKVSAKSGSGASTGSFSLRVDQLAAKDIYIGSENAPVKTDPAGFAAGTASIKINNVDISVTDADTIGDVMAKINTSGAGVNMKYDSALKSYVLESKASGADSAISIAGDSGEAGAFFARLGINIGEAVGTGGAVTSHVSAAQNAKVNYLGRGIEVEDGSNTVNINGVSVSLTPDAVGKTFSITVDRDPTATMDSIKKFVDEYNKLVDVLDSAQSTKRPKSGTYSYYEPLSDEQKEAMSDREVELWEKKAKTGMLYRDTLVSSIQTQMRTMLYEDVTLDNGEKISITNIGITTSEEGGYIGKLKIDDAKLSAALENNMDGVKQLFSKASDLPGSTTKQRNARLKSEGLAYRLDDIIRNAVTYPDGSLAKRAGKNDDDSSSDLYIQIKDFDERIKEMNQYLFERETYYYNMFSRMESAMSQSNNQMSSITAMAGM